MYKENFAKKLREARKEAGYTQKYVEECTGISQSILAYLETGKREPSIENLGTLIDFYGINANWLLGTGTPKFETESQRKPQRQQQAAR